MFGTLRRRFILSHVLPLLVIVPLTGLILIYILETQVLLPNLSDELTGNALLIAEILSDDPDIWRDVGQAEVMLTRLDPRLKGRIMLLDSRGHLLASSDPEDAQRIGQRLENLEPERMAAGQTSARTQYSSHLRTEITDVIVPVTGPGSQVLGAVRLSYPLTSVYDEFLRLRYLVAGVLLLGLLLGTAVGSTLALNLERPLHRLTEATGQLASGERLPPLPEGGPQEIRILLSTFNSLVNRLHSLERARRQLLANLVHELGRPLGALHSAVDALLDGADQQEGLRRELLAGIEGEVERLERLLNDLSRLHEQVLGTLNLNRRPTPVNAWLSRTLSVWREAAQVAGLDWHEEIATTLPTLKIDADRLGQALGNLLSNAIKYTPPGGRVCVDAGTKNDELWIRVSDTGPGVAPEEQERIFTPFYRSQADRRFPQGMGLGLGIARDLVAAHGGRLELESDPGEGSHFTIWLPV